MTTLKDVAGLAKTGYVSIARLESDLGLPRDKACRALLLCWEKGLLMPVVGAFFAVPEGGLPVEMGHAAATNRETWYAEELKQLREVFHEFDEETQTVIQVGMTVNDLKERLEIDGRANPLRQALKTLVELDEIQAFTATAGGAFGHRPVIYGNSMYAIKARNEELANEVVEKKAARKKEQPPPVPK